MTTKPCDNLNTTCEAYPACECGRAVRNVKTKDDARQSEEWKLADALIEKAYAGMLVCNTDNGLVIVLRTNLEDRRPIILAGALLGWIRGKISARELCGILEEANLYKANKN